MVVSHLRDIIPKNTRLKAIARFATLTNPAMDIQRKIKLFSYLGIYLIIVSITDRIDTASGPNVVTHVDHRPFGNNKTHDIKVEFIYPNPDTSFIFNNV